MNRRRRQPGVFMRLLPAVFILVLSATLAVAYSASGRTSSGAPGAQAANSTDGQAQPQDSGQGTDGAQPPPTTGASADAPQPRISLADRQAKGQVTANNAPIDPHCGQGCIARVAAGAAGKASLLWQGGNVAYVAATAEVFSSLSGATVVSPDLDTLALYVLYKVKPSQDNLLQKYGTVRDSADDVRLLEANHVPLMVNDLYSAGIWVEKLSPFAGTGAGSQSQPIPQTIKEFSAINAKDGVLGDREFDDAGTVMAAEYLYRRYTQLGFKVHYADFTGPDGSHQINVVADPPSSAGTPQALMVTGHYDSISPPGQVAPGADDNASGIAAMLELAARSAKAGFSPPITFVSFAAEEPGLYGSASYTQQLAARGVKLKAVINLDAVGIDNKGIVYINGNSDSRGIYKDLVALSSDKYWLEWMSSNYFLSDDEHFRRAGYPAVMVTTHPWGTEPRHHTPQDQVGNLDMGMINDLTDLVWSWFQKQG